MVYSFLYKYFWREHVLSVCICNGSSQCSLQTDRRILMWFLYAIAQEIDVKSLSAFCIKEPSSEWRENIGEENVLWFLIIQRQQASERNHFPQMYSSFLFASVNTVTWLLFRYDFIICRSYSIHSFNYHFISFNLSLEIRNHFKNTLNHFLVHITTNLFIEFCALRMREWRKITHTHTHLHI